MMRKAKNSFFIFIKNVINKEKVTEKEPSRLLSQIKDLHLFTN